MFIKMFYRILGQPRLEGSSKSCGPKFCGKGSLDEINQHPLWLHLENLQWRGPHHIPGEVVTVNVCSHYKKQIFYIKMKPLPVQLVPVAPYLLHVAFCEERASVLFLATL